MLFWVAVVVVVVIALWGWYFSPQQKMRRRMRAMPRTLIRSVGEGETVRVIGAVELMGAVRAPLSGRECAYWRVTVEEHRGSGKSARWVSIIDEFDGVDFTLRDETGKAWIETTYMETLLVQDKEFGSGFMREATPELEAFLAARGHTSKGFIFNKSMRYRESVVEQGERVCAVGVGRWERDPEGKPTAGGTYREAEMPMRLRLQSLLEGPLLLSDEPKQVEGDDG